MANDPGTPCPQCGHHNALGRMFCFECGAKLDMMAGEIIRARPRREFNLGLWIYRLIRFAILAALLAVLGLLLWPIPPEGREGTLADARSFSLKMERLDQAARRGEPGEAIFSEAEVNSYLKQITGQAREGGARRGLLQLDAGEIRLRLPEGRVVLFAHAAAGPLTLSYRIEGQPRFDGRQVAVEVSSAHLGHLPMPGTAATQWLARRVASVFAGMERERKVLDRVHRWESRDGAVKLITDPRPSAPLPPPPPRPFQYQPRPRNPSMKDKKEFYNLLAQLDGHPEAEYARLIGDFDFSRFIVKINQVYAEAGQDEPTLIVVRVPQATAAFPPHLHNTPVRRTALEDYLTRRVAVGIEAIARYDRQGFSRRCIAIAEPGQKILPRTSLLVTDEFIEARLSVRLPAAAGLISAEAAQDIFFEDIPHLVSSALIHCNLDAAELDAAVDLMEDADQIRQLLPTRGLVSFLAEGSLLARAPGSDEPNYSHLAPLELAESLSQEIETPNRGTLRGLGIPHGITLIMGDAYSGRIELVNAIAHGIYNHIPGDGRELVVTVPDAVQVASEAGRGIQRVDLSAFLSSLPGGADTAQHSAGEADPCAAQAAAAVEALEVGARVLVLDESSSSPAFLSRDSRLSGLLPGAESRVCPLSSRARQLADELGISIVVGGASCVSEFIPVADLILRVDGFKVYDITEQARALAVGQAAPLSPVANLAGLVERSRWIVASSIDPTRGREDHYVSAIAPDLLEFGSSTIDLHAVSQLADIHQTETIGRILYYAKLHYLDEGRPMREVLDLVDRDLSTDGLECLTRDLRGDLARPRRYEIAAALNRLDTLRISHLGE